MRRKLTTLHSMTITIMYRSNSEMYRPVKEFIELTNRRYPGKEIEEIELDSREGSELAKLYNIDVYPGIVVKSDSGSVLGTWKGLPMPLIDEVVSATLA